jgi:adenylate kinase
VAAAASVAGGGAAAPVAGPRLALLGPPNSGKGTQACALAARLGVPAISTGDMLRDEAEAGTELGRRVDAIMKAGRLVDDETMAEVVRERLARSDAAGGFLLDGYPRTLPQAETLDRLLAEQGWTLDAVVSLLVPEATLYERARGRGRADDAVLDERLRVYRENYPALAAYYAPAGLLREVDGDRAIDAVTEALLAAIGAAVAGAG